MPRHPLTKVPEITVYFWIIKVLTTAFGESLSDYLVKIIDPIIAVAIGAVLFAIAIALQFITRKYVAWVYWLAVAMVAVFGTMAADVLHVGFGIPYADSTTDFAVALGAIFLLWYLTERTLSIHSIYTVRREIFYWLTVMATFALGTAAGDLTAVTLGLGYLTSGALFAVLIALVAMVHYALKGMEQGEKLGKKPLHIRNQIIAFWIAYILTRPLGASFADWMGKAPNVGGLGWGDGTVAGVLGALIILFVVYISLTKVDVEPTER